MSTCLRADTHRKPSIAPATTGSHHACNAADHDSQYDTHHNDKTEKDQLLITDKKPHPIIVRRDQAPSW